MSVEEKRELFRSFFDLQRELDKGGFPYEFDDRYEVEPILERQPQLVHQYMDYLRQRGDLGSLINFLRLAESAPNYAASLLPVFQQVPQLFEIYAHVMRESREPSAQDREIDKRFQKTRLSSSCDPEVVSGHIENVRVLEKKLRALVGRENAAEMITRAFDDNVEVWVQRMDDDRLFVAGVRVLLRPHYEGRVIKKGFVRFPSIVRILLRNGIIDSSHIANGEYDKKGYLLVPNYEMNEQIILNTLADNGLDSKELVSTIESDEILENYITSGR